MTIALVRQASAVWSSGSSITVPITAPADGNTLIITVGGAAASPSVSSIAAIGGVTPARAAGPANAVRYADIWWAKNVTGAGTSVVVTLSGTGSSAMSVTVSEWSGISASATAVSPQTAAGNDTAPTTGATTPTAGRECVIMSAVRNSGTYSAGPTNSFTQLTDPDSPARHRAAYRIVASASGSYSTGYTSGTGTWDAAIVAFVNPAVGNAPTASITSQSLYSGTYEHPSGRSLTLTGTGTDLEDGTLTGSSLAWSSSRDGALGTGTSITTSTLSVGTHTITLTATDSNSNTGTATITIIVKDSANWQLYKRQFVATPIGGGSYQFGMQVLIPASYNGGTSYPLMMELGGSGQRGTDNTTQMTDGYAATALATPSAFATYGAIWVFPQWPSLGIYGGREEAFPMIAAALTQVQSEWNVNTRQLHLTGYSLGAQVALESLYNASPKWASVHVCAGAVTNREGLLSGNDPAGSWTNAQAAAEVAGRNATKNIRQYQGDADTNNLPATAQVTRDAWFAVDPTHIYYNYFVYTGQDHVTSYHSMQADSTILAWAFGIALAAGIANAGLSGGFFTGGL